ncbi:DUF475 domain-containing protein [Tundrisphaera sp. TA3]|uniref:DUF475 domain-containing protein n=1 Tax=Tundrisphaera sp. TA3 TaxID=3435775 RepID=UPI003EB8B24B
MTQYLLPVLLLAVMEVSLSFDNAVVNATVLRNMSLVWQRRFLTWGILIAVFGMRLVLPVVIVSVAGGMGMGEVARMAIGDPEEYGRQLASSHVAIASFGGIFLLMVFLGFLLDAGKETHWIGPLERHLVMVGRIEAAAIAIALAVILCLPTASLVPGMLGLLCYLFVNGLMGTCGDDPTACVSGKGGLAAFIYLEVLDASFSLDGVVGAFAMSNNIVVIMIGLGIGAAVIRTLTVRLVRGGTLSEFIYLEHGAHYGIGALAILMLVSTVYHVSEIVTGLAGVGFILLALASSVIHNRKGLAR